jgi:hypothetical protein
MLSKKIPQSRRQRTATAAFAAGQVAFLEPPAIAVLTSKLRQDAALWIYPLAALVAFRDLSALVEYAFGPKKRIHGFCNICGVAIRERFLIEGDKRMAINVRTMNGLDLDSLAVEKFDGKALLPKVPQAEAYR